MTSSGAASAASVKTTDHSGVLVAVVSGELDMISVDGVGTTLVNLVDDHPEGLVVDLAVDFMGSSGLSMLLELYGRAQREGVGFAVVATQAAALRSLSASALTQVLPVTQSVEEAMKLIREELKAGQ